MVLSPVLVIKGLTNTIRTQYLVPLKKEKYYINSVLSGAATNLVFNFVLIPRLGAMGAVLGTIFAELVACLIQFCVIAKEFYFRKYIQNCMLYILSGIIMFFVVRILSMFQLGLMFKLILEITVGVIVYVGLTGFWVYITKSQIYDEIFSGFIRQIIGSRKNTR